MGVHAGVSHRLPYLTHLTLAIAASLFFPLANLCRSRNGCYPLSSFHVWLLLDSYFLASTSVSVLFLSSTFGRQCKVFGPGDTVFQVIPIISDLNVVFKRSG